MLTGLVQYSEGSAGQVAGQAGAAPSLVASPVYRAKKTRRSDYGGFRILREQCYCAFVTPTVTSTRRFCARPAEVELSATGADSPIPLEVMIPGLTPLSIA